MNIALSCRFLLDQGTLNICNRWRRDRGLSELRLSDLAPADSQAM